VLRVVGVLWFPVAGLIACSTVPSTSSSDYSDSGRMIGELIVYDQFVIAGSPDTLPEESTLMPGRYRARLDKLQRDELVLDIDAPAIGDLAVHLRDGVGRFPEGTGGFSFTASQHDLPYTIHGDHLFDRRERGSFRERQTCYIEELRESCNTSDNGETVCSVYTVYVSGSRPMVTTTTVESQDLALTFVDAQEEVVVARYHAFTEPRVVQRTTPEGVCQY
jgi:hypothetical protein